ncbi:MAG: hypothetical protein N2747_02250 [Chitinophagaceae bacterium]|nr:hypothetical protein [Chitinophagaceae bacterium]
MKLFFTFSIFLLMLSSCSTAYKTGQTPDDVYYSPLRPQEEYTENKREKEGRYEYTDEYYDDRYLRMKVRNRQRWSDLDDWYLYDRYSIGFNCYYGSFYNPYNAWNYYYNPYCHCVNPIVFIPSPSAPSAPPVIRKNFSAVAFQNTQYNNANTGGAEWIKTRTITANRGSYNQQNTSGENRSEGGNKGLSQKLKTIFSSDNTESRPSRIYLPSESGTIAVNTGSSGSSGKSNSGGGSISRPARGDN